MIAAIHSRSRGFLAAVTCAAVVGGLAVAPPEPTRLAAARVEMVAVQLTATAASEIGAAVHSDQVVAAVTEGIYAPVPSAVASATGVSLLSSLVFAAAAVVGGTLWYLATPVTLPLSVVGGIALFDAFSRFTFFGGSSAPKDPLTVVGIGAILGLAVYAGGPLLVLTSTLSPFASLFAPYPSAASPAAANADSAADSAAAPAGSGAAQSTYADVPALPGGRAAAERSAETARPDSAAQLVAAVPAAGAEPGAVDGDDAPASPERRGGRTSAVADGVEATARQGANRGSVREGFAAAEPRRGR